MFIFLIYFITVIQKLIAEGFKIPTGSLILFMELYLNLNKLTEAKEIFENIKANDTDLLMDKYKVVKMAEVIAKLESVESKFLCYLITKNPPINLLKIIVYYKIFCIL